MTSRGGNRNPAWDRKWSTVCLKPLHDKLAAFEGPKSPRHSYAEMLKPFSVPEACLKLPRCPPSKPTPP